MKQATMARLYHSFLCLLVVLGASIPFFPIAKATTIAGCSKAESDALLTFKDGVIDPANRLSSWQGQVDCCRWSGVVCQNISSYVHVVELNLEDDDYFNYQTALSGQLLNPSLLSLTYLSRLNLSGNDFGWTQIPQSVGSFSSLRYLDLSWTNFGGRIPAQLGNLSTLLYLDLSSYWSFSATNFVLYSQVDSMEWLKQLTSLRYLNMNAVNLNAASHEWLQAVNMLHSLEALHLPNCDLAMVPSSLSFVNLTALEILDLSANLFMSTLPTWLWEFSSLSYLDLESNEFYGLVPAAVGNLTSLDTLILGENNLDGGTISASITHLIHLNTFDFSYNNMSGGVPDWLMLMTNLTHLDLSFCSMKGLFPVEIGSLSNLVYLDLSSNSLQGTVSELHLANLTTLETLYLSNNSLSILINEEWNTTMKLKHIGFSSCNLGPHFPRWLQRQRSIVSLDLSNASIKAALPDWLWSSWPALGALDISHNNISGSLPQSLEGMEELQIIMASSNMLQGVVPTWPSSMRILDLSSNSLSGSLPTTSAAEHLSFLLLANNQINGSMPSYFCNMTYLYYIDISNNQIEGEIPPCWNSSELIFMRLSNNNLSGSIPSSAMSQNLRYLNLNNNSLSGELPPSLQNCSLLTVLDLGENKLSGNIPIWIGVSLQELSILRLRSNTLSGSIPPQLAQLSNLHIVDLSNNQLLGLIPSSFGNFSAMISTSKYITVPRLFGIQSFPKFIFRPTVSITLSAKGQELGYSTSALDLVKSIDLSSNDLTGKIPQELGALVALQTLNLSRNKLQDRIPDMFAGIRYLETLDLSFNNLSGAIPESLSRLSMINHLNLSYNNLSGRIPSSNQLQTLDDPYIYAGNAYLCGPPVSNNCSATAVVDREAMDYGSELASLYVGCLVGFLVGLSGVFILLCRKSWRYYYFETIDKYYHSFRVNQWRFPSCNQHR
ncbi:receptor-like protein EIX1 [Zingiber officinale]|uniref:Leucine-rich repeat-containing N-terminal plant-type domain-containing protein n=1 Tax=Zingiber officinale TaxID=94328 RepID=A0A8J5KUY2_ZINOF|nr:receptor-like protein EIX1 [Zingiber officinale]KAG6500348.1 hypothetical protein ZIOFF_040193 [Zingiber officinale]